MTVSASESERWPFRAGDVWCAAGDSITQSGGYHRDIYLFHLTRFPARQIRQINRGLAGDTATGALRRLENDILSPLPTVVTVMFGMNDVDRFAYRKDSDQPDVHAQRSQAIATCLQSLRGLAERIEAAGVRVVLLTPSIFDQTAMFADEDNTDALGPEAEGVNTGLGRIAQGVRELAAKQRTPVVDFHAEMTLFNAEAQKADAAFTLVGPDRVHPGAEGHFFMTRVFLEAFGAPHLVSSVEVEVGKPQGLALNGFLDGLESSPNHVEFIFHAGSLPFPVDATLPESSVLADFQERYNQELLRVRGLNPGRYRLSIDAVTVGAFTASELEDGINLADIPGTPQYQQALRVRELVRRRHQLISESLRGLSYVEHGYLKDAGIEEGDMPATRRVLKEKLEPIRGEPWFEYVKSQFESYVANKARELEMLDEAAELEAAIWEGVRPIPRRYRIESVVP